MMKYTEADITILPDCPIQVKGIGPVGIWWENNGKAVAIDRMIGPSFYANTKEEVIAGVLRIINNEVTNEILNPVQRKTYSWMVPGGDDSYLTFLYAMAGGLKDMYICICEDAHGDTDMEVLSGDKVINKIGTVEFLKLKKHLG